MGDLRRDTTGNWWFHVVGKGNKAAKISVRDEYVERYLVRYRHFLQISPLPSPQEKTPLIATHKGRGGLSDRHVGLGMPKVELLGDVHFVARFKLYYQGDQAPPSRGVRNKKSAEQQGREQIR